MPELTQIPLNAGVGTIWKNSDAQEERAQPNPVRGDERRLARRRTQHSGAGGSDLGGAGNPDIVPSNEGIKGGIKGDGGIKN